MLGKHLGQITIALGVPPLARIHPTKCLWQLQSPTLSAQDLHRDCKGLRLTTGNQPATKLYPLHHNQIHSKGQRSTQHNRTNTYTESTLDETVKNPQRGWRTDNGEKW